MECHRIIRPLFAAVILLSASACGGQEQKNESSGSEDPLANSASPYLRMHADNPVDWRTWGSSALDTAKARNSLLIVSVGYTACHWCHVMEEESFMDSSVARLMNQDFVPIKVDREKRPAVDDRYMKAARLSTGNGGWPLNAIALPDGRPVMAVTYLPKRKWKKLLRQVNRQWERDPDKLREQARKIQDGIASMNRPPTLQGDTVYTEEDLDAIFQRNWKGKLDRENGGAQGSPKFPMPIQYHHLMGYAQLSGNGTAEDAVHEALKGMARGGIHDHVGGGFHRYSTDAEWKVPHFEKMLYDNGQLMELYSDAYRWSDEALYRRTVERGIRFLEREMRDRSGAFYASLSAVVDGVEGKSYTWTLGGLQEVLSKEELRRFRKLYPVSEKGNWKDGRNVLDRERSLKRVAEELDFSADSLRTELDGLLEKLREKRDERKRPKLDDKRITAWNGMLISGLSAAYQAFHDPEHLELAEACAQRFWKARESDKGLFPRTLEGNSRSGYLDDHAFMIKAYIDLYEAGLEEKWLLRAEELTETVLDHYASEELAPFFRYRSKGVGKMDGSPQLKLQDGTVPSPNSTMAHQLFRLHQMLHKPAWKDRSRDMLARMSGKLPEHPVHHANWARLMLLQVHTPYQVAIVGSQASEKKERMEAHYFPHVFYLGGNKEGELDLLQNKRVEGRTRIYVCRERVCKRPVNRVEEALQQIRIEK